MFLLLEMREGRKSSSVIVPPIPIRVRSKVAVEVAWVIRNLGSCPTRQLDLILGICNFDFGDDQPVVIPVKNVDLPGPAGKNLAVPRLLDERSFAKLIQHHRRVAKPLPDQANDAPPRLARNWRRLISEVPPQGATEIALLASH
jgi:hypothetical protein